MKLSTKGRYGLRAMVDLAVHETEGPVSIQSIADRQELSEKYLEQLLGMLKRAGLVTASRGSQGGYRLAKDSGHISAGDILRALEGDLSPVDCAGFSAEPHCKSAGSCVTKYVWRRLKEAVEDTLNGISLKELASRSRSLEEKGEQNASPANKIT